MWDRYMRVPLRAVSVQFHQKWTDISWQWWSCSTADSVQFQCSSKRVDWHCIALSCLGHPQQIQCSFSAVSVQFQNSWLTDWTDCSELFGGSSNRFSAVTVQFRCSFGAVSEQFQKHSKKLCYSFRAISDQFHMFNRAMPGQFLNSFRAVSEQFQVTSNAVQQTKKKKELPSNFSAIAERPF